MEPDRLAILLQLLRFMSRKVRGPVFQSQDTGDCLGPFLADTMFMHLPEMFLMLTLLSKVTYGELNELNP